MRIDTSTWWGVCRVAFAATALCVLMAAGEPVLAASAHPADDTLQYPHVFPNSAGKPNSQTSGKPGIAACHGELYVAWTGNASPYHMLISHTTNPFNTGGWSTPQVLNDTANQPTGPSLACFKNQLYIAWAGTDASHHLNVGYYTDRNATLHNKQTLSQSSKITPDIAPSSADGRLYLVWRGRDNTNLYLTSSSDGIGWASSIVFGDTSPLGPSIGEAIIGGQYRKYLAWQSTGNTQTIYTGYFNGSSALQDHHNTGLQISTEPDLVSVGPSNSTLYAVFVFAATIWQYWSTDGLIWHEVIGYLSPSGLDDPVQGSVAEFSGHIWVAVRDVFGVVGVAEIPNL